MTGADGGPLYETIGGGYDETRRADPGILARLRAHLGVRPGRRYLDLACGTGNYTAGLAPPSGAIIGLDQSVRMLARAREKAAAGFWACGDARRLPFADATFDGAVCTLAVHHFADVAAAFAELHRVLGGAARFVLFTAQPEQMRAYWLVRYFPTMMARAIERMPPLSLLNDALAAAGFDVVGTEPWFVPRDPVDLFLYAGKHEPALYLDARVRAGISAFATLSPPDERAHGLARLARDIETGAIDAIIAASDNAQGDYLFVIARA